MSLGSDFDLCRTWAARPASARSGQGGESSARALDCCDETGGGSCGGACA